MTSPLAGTDPTGYHDRDQHGSASIKDVLPVLTDTGYEGLAIRDGNAASRAFARMASGAMDPAAAARTRRDLEEYCALDTKAMADIAEALRGLV